MEHVTNSVGCERHGVGYFHVENSERVRERHEDNEYQKIEMSKYYIIMTARKRLVTVRTWYIIFPSIKSTQRMVLFPNRFMSIVEYSQTLQQAAPSGYIVSSPMHVNK